MVTRIGLAVALACVAVPTTLMGSTWYFIRQNPALDTCSFEGDTAIWCQDIIEIDGDSTPITPDSFVTTDSAGLDSLGLQGPNAELLAATLGNYAVDSQCAPNRMWKSWLIGGDCWVKSKHYRTMTGASGTYRPGNFNWGYVAVADSIYGNGTAKAYNYPWHHDYNNAIVVCSHIMYPWGLPWWEWQVWGNHSWGSDRKTSNITLPW